ncbi:MAG: methyltransferase domain-containing protein [Thermoplasmata archaeon]
MIGEVPRAFDTIAPAYDATRDPLDKATLEGVAQHLRTEGVHGILEVGVGTGRVARPLHELGFEVTGIDASRGMLALARAKGLPRLVRGSAYHLPFADDAFDGALMVHVLHLLEEPRTALTEATRASRRGAWALVHPPGGEVRSAPSENEPRRIVFRLLAKQGYPVPARGGGPPEKERSILRQFPPDSVTVITDRMVTEPLAKRLDMIAQGASRHTMNIPKDVLRQAVEVARSQVGDRTFSYRRIEALARWSAATVAAYPAALPEP